MKMMEFVTAMSFFLMPAAACTRTVQRPDPLPVPPSAKESPPVAPVILPDDPEVPIADALADDAAGRFVWRAHVRKPWLAAFTRGGKPVGRTNMESDDEMKDLWILVVVLERHPESVRAVFEDKTARLSAFFPLEALDPTPTQPVRLEQGSAVPASGITVHPAIRVHWQKIPDAQAWKLRHDEDGIEFEGTLPASSVTWVFSRDVLREPTDGNTHIVHRPEPILDAPGGRVLARVTQAGLQSHPTRVRTQSRRDGYAFIVLKARGYVVKGWIAQDAIKPLQHEDGLPEDGFGFEGGWGTSNSIQVEEGTRLFACPNGPQVGIVLRTTRFGDRDMEQGFRKIYGYNTSLHFWYELCVEEKKK